MCALGLCRWMILSSGERLHPKNTHSIAREKSESQRSDARACTVLLYTASFAIEKLFVKDKVFESCDEQQVAEAF